MPQVCTDGKLILEFTFDDLMRIKSWHFAVRAHRELIPRSVIAMQQDPSMVESLGKNITRQGLTTQTLNYLRVRVAYKMIFIFLLYKHICSRGVQNVYNLMHNKRLF